MTKIIRILGMVGLLLMGFLMMALSDETDKGEDSIAYAGMVILYLLTCWGYFIHGLQLDDTETAGLKKEIKNAKLRKELSELTNESGSTSNS